MKKLVFGLQLRAASPRGVLSRFSILNQSWHYAKKVIPALAVILLFFLFLRIWSKQGDTTSLLRVAPEWLLQQTKPQQPIIIVITPTHKRPERLADMTRFSQTLSHIKDLHWVVVEDGNGTVPAVERILQRSKLPYVYFSALTEKGFPRRGWTHRNRALQYIRQSYATFKGEAVVYFADDDNTYDIRLFDNYIRKVKRLGLWAVGLSGAALVEAPKVVNKTIVAWDVVFAPRRTFATDMAGFAINLREILRVKNATFSNRCTKKEPEPCFLDQFGIPKEQAEPFGYDDNPKEVLVWHTKTRNVGTRGERHGYVVE